MRINRFFLVALAASVLFITACVKDKFNLDKLASGDWSPEFAAPLAYGSLTLEDVVNRDSSGFFTVDANGLITIIYRDNLLSLTGSELLDLPDQNLSFLQSISAAEATALNLAPVGSTYAVPLSKSLDFNTGGVAEIDTMFFKSGSINIDFNYYLPYDASIVLTIPSATKNGVIYSKTFSISYSGVTYKGSSVLDLTGYKFDMTDGGTTNSKIKVNIDVSITKSALQASAGPLMDMTFGFKSPKFSKMFGYISQVPLTPDPDTVDIGMFKGALPNGTTFSLADPRFKIIISNSYGLPISGSFSQLDGISNGVATPVVYTGSPNPLNPLNIPYPTILQIGQYATDSFSLDNTNSNIAAVLNSLPSKAVFSVTTITNPSGKPVAPNTNFLLDTSALSVDMEIQLPLHGKLKNFVMQDTNDYSFSDLGEGIEKLGLRAFIENGFPFEMGVQVYFTDSISPLNNYRIVDSLVTPYKVLMPAAVVNSTTGDVVSRSEQTIDVSFDKTRIDKLKNVNHIIIKGVANTANNGNTDVKFYASYRMDVKLGAQIKIKAKL